MARRVHSSRRDLLQGMAAVGGVAAVHGALGGAFLFAGEADAATWNYLAVVADHRTCTGCRTCETACAAANHPVEIDGVVQPGLGNPRLARIRIHRFSPDVAVPIACARCDDAPCVAACPVPEDETTGRRALFRDRETGTIRHDPERCIGCRSCAATCKAQRTGTIVADPATGQPTGICTLCDGDPQCVEACPFGALTVRRGRLSGEFRGQSPQQIAEALLQRWYEVTP